MRDFLENKDGYDGLAVIGASTGCSELRPAHQLSRRASHIEVGAGGAETRRDLLVVPSQRSRGVSLPGSISSTDLYRLR